MKKRPLRSKLRKVLRIFLLVLLLGILVQNIYIALTGKWYFYSALSKTYFIGQSGPGIYDLKLFPYQTIIHDKTPYNIPESTSDEKELSAEENAYFESLETTSFLVLLRDSVIFEKYWKEHTPETVSNTFSAAKSIVSLLIGIAVEEGYIGSIDEFIGEYIEEWNKAPYSKITIRDLLTMSTGLGWHESGGNPFSDNAEAYYGTDLEKLVLKQEVVEEPGKEFEYISSATQVLTIVLERATGLGLSVYFQDKIWSKIGSGSDAYWSLDKEGGIEKGYCCLYATTRDFAKIGLLIANDGVWKGERIVPEWYMKEAFVPADIKVKGGGDNHRYGLHWWVVPTEEDTVRYARGIQGQYIVVVPGRDLVVVRTGHKRASDYREIPPGFDDFPESIKPQIGHPGDLFVYLKVAMRLADQE